MRFIFSYCFNYKDEIYFFLEMIGILCKYDFDSNRISIVSDFKIDDFPKGYSYEWRMSFCNGGVGLANNGTEAVFLSLNDYSIKKIPLETSYLQWGNYAYACRNDNKAYIFVRDSGKMICIDELSYRVHATSIPTDIFWGDRVNDDVILVSKNGGNVYSFSIDGCEYRELSGIVLEDEIVTIAGNNKDVFILTKSGSLYRYDLQSESFEYYCQRPNCGFGIMVATNNNIVILPDGTEEIYTVDRESRRIQAYKNCPPDLVYRTYDGWCNYLGCCEYAGKLFFAMRSANYFLIIDRETGEITWKKPRIPSEKKMIEHFSRYTQVGIRESAISISDYIRYVKELN